MDTSNWIAVGIAVITLISHWAQFWVKERLFTTKTTDSPFMDSLLRSKSFVSLIAFSGVLSAVSIWLLLRETLSLEPLTRLSCFFISALAVMSVLNMVLVQSLVTLRRLAVLRHDMKVSEANQMAFAAAHG